MKHRTFALVVAIATALVLVSCASTQKKPAEPAIPESVTKARTAADESKAKAVEVKAAVAAKPSFDKAEAEYASAKTLETAKDYEKAVAGYTASKALYDTAWSEANAKREKALAAMNKAGDERKQSEAAIKEAETEAPK